MWISPCFPRFGKFFFYNYLQNIFHFFVINSLLSFMPVIHWFCLFPFFRFKFLRIGPRTLYMRDKCAIENVSKSFPVLFMFLKIYYFLSLYQFIYFLLKSFHLTLLNFWFLPSLHLMFLQYLPLLNSILISCIDFPVLSSWLCSLVIFSCWIIFIHIGFIHIVFIHIGL